MKSFKTFSLLRESDEDIIARLKQIGVIDGFKIKDGVVYATRSRMHLEDLRLKEIPVQFGQSNTSFTVMDNELENLKGSPPHCKTFNAAYNKLTSLEGAPQSVEDTFSVSGNSDLKSLEHCPQKFGKLVATGTGITSLKGLPRVSGGVYVRYTPIDNLDGAPEEINGDLDLRHCQIKSFQDAHKKVHKVNGTIYIAGNPAKDVIHLLLIEGVSEINGHPLKGYDEDLDRACTILNKYLGKGQQGVMKAQRELLENDLDDYA